MLKRIALAALSMALLTGTALAQYTITNAGPINSAGDIGDSGNGSFTSTYTGASSLYGSFSFSGNLTAVNPITYAEEAGFYMQQTSALGGMSEVVIFPTLGEEITGTLPVNFTTSGMFWFRNNAEYRIEAFEDWDDGPGADAAWTDLDFTFSDTVSITDIGSFLVGTPIVFDTEGSIGGIDTQIAVFTADGFLIDTDDDSGSGFLSLLDLGNLPTGNYYFTLGTYASVFADGLAVSNGDGGSFVINMNGSQVSSGELGAGELKVLGFSVVNPTAAPEPGTLALLGLVALPGAALLRRRK